MMRLPKVVVLLSIVLGSTFGGLAFANSSSAPVVPAGFNRDLLKILACPENLTSVRFATKTEILRINARIKAKEIKTWGEKVVLKPVEALLIREDGKVGYRADAGVPVMLIEEALVLDPSVGKPNPDKHRAK